MNLNQPVAPVPLPTSARDLPILYIKSGCPWCEEVVDFLGEHGIGYREKNVSQDNAAFEEMRAKSGQAKAPTLDWHGKILADFGVMELKPFLRKQNIKFEDS
jgi:glutaredoxin